jgi:hypothetical protein
MRFQILLGVEFDSVGLHFYEVLRGGLEGGGGGGLGPETGLTDGAQLFGTGILWYASYYYVK